MKTLQRDCIYSLLVIQLSIEDAQKVMLRLKIPSNLKNIVLDACRLWGDVQTFTQKTPSQIVNRLDGVKPQSIYSVYLACDQESIKQKLSMYITKWKHVSTTIDGSELKKIGVPPGPIYREILNELRDAWLDGTITNVAEEKQLFRKLLHRWQ
jgi:tRNA nucleotidyltransferase (CCA-adding enzyme)